VSFCLLGPVLYQGTTSVVPLMPEKSFGLQPLSTAIEPSKNPLLFPRKSAPFSACAGDAFQSKFSLKIP
jgi:hypothetical protein